MTDKNEIRVLKKVNYKNKEFWIVEWNDPFKDFPYPKGFKIAEFNDFIELYDNNLIELEMWKGYFVKHFSKKQQAKEFCLSGLFVNRYSNLNSNSSDLILTNMNGRLIICRDLKIKDKSK